MFIPNFKEETKQFKNGFTILIGKEIFQVDSICDESIILLKENKKLKEFTLNTEYEFYVRYFR